MPLFSSSQQQRGYLPLSGSSASRASSPRTMRRLAILVSSALVLALMIQGLIYLPYLAGEDRAKSWGLEQRPDWWNQKQPPWKWTASGPSSSARPLTPTQGQQKPGSHGVDHPIPRPPILTNTDDTVSPYSPTSDKLRIGPQAFPPPWSSLFHFDAIKQYSDGDPHSGIIPSLQRARLDSISPAKPPTRPKPAPAINASIWSRPAWSPALNGSKTSFADSFKAHLQPIEEERRMSPYNTWVPPREQLDPSIPPVDRLGQVQYAFRNPSKRSGTDMDPQREEVLAERQRLVKASFLHAWEGYKRIAWGHDEVRPVSESAQDPFNGWGATIVDALDTLLVMDLPREYDLAREHVRDIDFWLVGGERSAYGSSDGRIPVFETAIRYLGGFLSAYDLSGDELMRDRAEELAQMIMPAFFTRTGVPLGRIRFGQTPYPGAGGGVVLAEAGSLLLEFTRLWQVTGNRTYFDRVQRTTDWLDRNMTTGAKLGALLPTTIFPESGTGYGSYSFGGMADSYYEYLIKGHQLLGGKVSQYGRMYSEAIDSARKYLIKDVNTVPGTSLVSFGVLTSRWWEPRMEHLACFTGGMMGLGAKLMPVKRGQDIDLAQRLTETCWWTYNSSATGVGPESTVFYRDDTASSSWSTESNEARGWPIQGVSRQQTDYRSRPETIESVFYMWRVTGDSKWQDRGWQMFASWVTHAMTKVGFANIHDVQAVPAYLGDSMESFVFAETFKYYYLLFSPPDLVSLDDFVLTTEAHPLLVPKEGRWAEPGKGPRKFWEAPSSSSSASPGASPAPASDADTASSAESYSGGEGGPIGGLTNVQKHFVYARWVEKQVQAQREKEAAMAKAKLAEVVERAKLAGSDAVAGLVARMKEFAGAAGEAKTASSLASSAASSEEADKSKVERRSDSGGSVVPRSTDDQQQQQKQPPSGVSVEDTAGMTQEQLTQAVLQALQDLRASGKADFVDEHGQTPASAIIETSRGPVELIFQQPDADEEVQEGLQYLGDDEQEESCADVASEEASADMCPRPHSPPVVVDSQTEEATPTLSPEVANDADLAQIRLAGDFAIRDALRQLKRLDGDETETEGEALGEAVPTQSSVKRTPLGGGFVAPRV